MNLTKARKARARVQKQHVGDANAARHGRTKAEREADAARDAKAQRHLDGHRRDDE